MIPVLFALPAFVSLGLNANLTPVTGDYLEVRSNEIYTCACRYSGAQFSGGAEAILAWSIRGGEFQGASLAGTRAVAVVQGQTNLALDGVPRQSVLFVDANSDAQQRALTGLLREHYGSVLGEVLAVHAAPVSFERRGEEVLVSAGETVTAQVRPARLPEDAHQGSSLWYQPFIPVAGAALMVTEYSRFSGGEFRHTWWDRDPGITAFMAQFRLPAAP